MTTQNWKFALLVAGLATAATVHAQQIGVNATSTSNSGVTFWNPTGAALPPGSFTGNAAAASNSNASFGASFGVSGQFQPPGSINANAGFGNLNSGIGSPGNANLGANANLTPNANVAPNANLGANGNVTGNANLVANANAQPTPFTPNGRFDDAGNFFPAGSAVPSGRFDQSGMFLPNPAFQMPNQGTFNTNAPGFSNGNIRTVVPAGNDMQGFFPGNQTPASFRNGNLIVTNGNTPTDTGGVLR